MCYTPKATVWCKLTVLNLAVMFLSFFAGKFTHYSHSFRLLEGMIKIFQEIATPRFDAVIKLNLNKWMGTRGQISWPPCSPVFRHSNFLLWGLVNDKQRHYSNQKEANQRAKL